MTTRDTPWSDGTPCWVDLMTTDLESAKHFYGTLFGWNLVDAGEEAGHYHLADIGGRAVAGIGPMMPGMEHPPVWATYLATSDVAASADAAVRAGASLVVPAMDVMDVGKMAVVQDPTGAAIGMWQPGTRFGFELANEPGSVTWNEQMSRDFDAAKEFYAAVFGYTYGDMSEGDMKYAMIEVDGNAVGGIGSLPAEVPAAVPAHWRMYFHVEDCDKTAAMAADLGGTVISPPQDMPYGRWADIADPQGATFSVLTPPAAPAE